MAYTDNKGMSAGKLWSIIIVIAIHALLAYAFITGLAYTVAKKVADELNVINVEEPPPPPPEELPPPPPKTELPPPPVVTPPPLVQTQVVQPTVTTVNTPPPAYTPSVEQPRPAPPAPPAAPPAPPAAPAVGVKPRGNPGSWATNDDYPPAAQREGVEGTTGFRLEIGTDGRVTACSITSSSGSSALDDTTCKLMMRRARFSPGRDTAGNAIGGQYSSRVRWQIDK